LGHLQPTGLTGSSGRIAPIPAVRWTTNGAARLQPRRLFAIGQRPVQFEQAFDPWGSRE